MAELRPIFPELLFEALATTYKVNVVTSDKVGSGTNANVYIIIFGKHDDTGKVPLTISKTHNDPFERGHTDVFEIEFMDIGEPKKIKIGHDDAGFRPDWLLERVHIDVPKLGHSWVFPCGKWLSKSKGDCQLEVELYPKDMATEVYNPFVPYEIKVFTSKLSGAGTDANVRIEIYGEDKTTGEIMLCGKTDRKGKFQMGSINTFVPELEDVGEDIEKIRIGHDNHGFGAAWHLDHVEIRRFLKGQKTKTFIFPCNRWFAKDEDDKSIVRELVPERVIEEKLDESGQLQVREKEVRDKLEMKQYVVEVYTGDTFGCGTNANVFCTIFGDKGDTGERELEHSETHANKFGRGNRDKFKIECADLGNIYKFKIRHDNSGLFPDWLLSRVEVIDGIKTYVFYCEQWLAKGKGDSKIERTLYEKDYQGPKSSFGSVPRSISGSRVNLLSNKYK